jgi:hypothetical protein
MSKCRIIGAGCAGSTVYHCNVNLNTAGGTKKQGSPVSLDSPTVIKPVLSRSKGVRKDFVFTMNQLGGGVGRRPMYNADGVKAHLPYNYNNPTAPDPCAKS